MQQQQFSESIYSGARHGFGAGRWKGALVAVKVIDHRVKGNGNAVDIQRETILSTSVVHPNVVSVASYPVPSAGGSHSKADCRQQRICMMAEHAIYIPPVAYASMNDARCKGIMRARAVSERFTPECSSFACGTLLVHTCRILHRCIEVDAMSISYASGQPGIILGFSSN